MRMVTAQTPTNIAVIKYWGKRDETLILPVNDSISVTLDPAHLCTITTVAVSPSFDQDRMWLNGKVECFSHSSVSIWLLRNFLKRGFNGLMMHSGGDLFLVSFVLYVQWLFGTGKEELSLTIRVGS